MRIPRPAAEKLGAGRQDPDQEGSCGKALKNAGCALSTTNEIYCNLAPRKRACLASVPVADEAAGGGERTMGGDRSAEGGTREGRVRGTLGPIGFIARLAPIPPY